MMGSIAILIHGILGLVAGIRSTTAEARGSSLGESCSLTATVSPDTNHEMAVNAHVTGEHCYRTRSRGRSNRTSHEPAFKPLKLNSPETVRVELKLQDDDSFEFNFHHGSLKVVDSSSEGGLETGARSLIYAFSVFLFGGFVLALGQVLGFKQRNRPRHPITAATLLAGLLCSVPTKAEAEAEALVRFVGRGVLHGVPLAMDGRSVNWLHSLSGTTCSLRMDFLRSITFDASSPNILHGDILMLDNGDRLSGTILSLDDHYAVMRTRLFGDVKIPRGRLRAGRIAPGPDLVPTFTNQEGFNAWKKIGSGKAPQLWLLKADALVFPGQNAAEDILADCRLSPATDISFDASWKLRPSSEAHSGPFSVDICTGVGETAHISGGYRFRFFGGALSCQRMTRTGSDKGSWIGQVVLQPFLQDDKALRMRIIVDRPRRLIHVLLNGRLAAKWKDSSPSPPEGSGVVFGSYHRVPVEIRNFSAYEWNGLLEDHEASIDPPQDGKDHIDLHDDDSITGRVVSLHPAEGDSPRVVTFETASSKTPLQIPAERVKYLVLAAQGAPQEAGASVRMRDGSRVSGVITKGDRTAIELRFDEETVFNLPVKWLRDVRFHGGPRENTPAEGGPEDEEKHRE